MRAFVWFLGLVALGLAAIALFTYPAWLLLHPHFDFPFHRIGERIGMLALLGGFLAVARRLNLADRVSLGYGLARRAFLRELGVGAVLGCATMLAVVALMGALGLRDWTPLGVLSGGALAKLVVQAALSALTVALIEETFLRGAMHTAIERQSGPRVAVLLTAALYAATHFFASYHISAQQVTPWSGLALLAGTLHAFAAPVTILDAFLALFAVGVVLGGVRVATGNIAACIGLHAGWVWIMLIAHELSAPRRTAPLGFLLSRFDGFVGWLVLAATLAMAVPLWRFFRARRVAG
jgi:uncharacterized protein